MDSRDSFLREKGGESVLPCRATASHPSFYYVATTVDPM